MANGYYNHGNLPGENTPGSSAEIRAEFDAVTDGFNKIAPVTGNANKVVVINAAETGQTVKAADALISDTIHAATSNATPADAVEFGFWDNVAGALRKCSLTNLKAVLKTYFDTQYAALAGLATQTFSVAAATAAAHAVRKDQLDAAAGHIGEVIESVVAAVDAPTSGQYGDLTSINLTIGIWDIGTNTLCLANGATVTACVGGIGTATGNSSTGLVAGDTSSEFLPPTAGSATSGCVTKKRYVVAAPTTLYLKMFANYTVATPKFYGRITATRSAL